MRRVHNNPRKGFSLLEAILAIAILGTSLAALSQVMSTGVDAGLEAEDLIQCRMAAVTRMNELLIDLDMGITPVTTLNAPVQSFVQSQTESDLVADTLVTPAAMAGLLVVAVTVRSDAATFTLTQWVIDPVATTSE